VHAIRPRGDNLADEAFVDPLHRLFERLEVAAHQTTGDFEVFLARHLARLQHPPDAGRIDRKGFFHEHVDALLHRILEMNRAEGWRRGQQHHVTLVQRVDGVFKRIEADEAALWWHVDLASFSPAETLQAALHAMLKDVGQRPEHGWPRRGQGLEGGAGAAASTTDDRHLDGVVLGGITRAGQGHRSGQRRASDGGTRSFEEFTAGGKQLSGLIGGLHRSCIFGFSGLKDAPAVQ
jgi:hypothetical protein